MSADLVAAARAMSTNTPPVIHYTTTWTPAIAPEAVTLLTEMADEIERLHAEVAKLGVKRDKHRREYRDLHISCEQRVMERNDAWARLDRIREALAGHPRCDVHPDDDVISCGWKRAVASVQWALDTTEPTTEENPDV